jgi:hypothetical protein
MSRYKGWDNDTALEDDLRNYVRENLKRAEMLSFVRRDYYHYSQYQWRHGVSEVSTDVFVILIFNTSTEM